jgi:peptidyl-prolyl cis-trans isomerase D
MRKNVKSLAPTLWFVIIAFIISIFAVWGGAGRLGEGRGTNIIATVGKQKISADLYYQTLRQRLEMLKREYKDLDSRFIQQLNIPQQVLNQIIQQSLLKQLAADLGIKATDDEIRQKIMNYPVFQKDGQFIGFAQYKRILEWNRIPLAEFEKSLEDEIVIEKVVNLVTAGITASPEELWENYKNNNNTAQIEYVVLEVEKIELDEKPTLSELQTFYEKNKEKYTIPEKREADYFFLETENLKEEVELAESELQKYYEENSERFQEPEKVKASRIFIPFEEKETDVVLNEARNILDRIKKGEDFMELAKAFSKDEKAQEGGDWGVYDWKRLPSIEQEEINGLAQGEVSDVLESDEGAVILKVTEREPESVPPFDSVKDRITNILKDQKARSLAEEKISQLEKAAQKEGSLDVAAQKLGYQIRTTGPLKNNDPIEEIDPSGLISKTLFELEEKIISSPIYTYRGVGLAQLMNIEPPRPATFEEAQEQIEEDFVSVKKKQSAAETMQKVKQELRRKNLERLAQEYDLEYEMVEEHKRGQYLSTIGENSEIDRLSFALPLNEASDPVELETGYALIRVLDRQEVTEEDFNQEKEAEKEKYLETKRNKFFQSYLSKVQQEKEVKIKYDLFLKLNSDVISRFTGEQE